MVRDSLFARSEVVSSPTVQLLALTSTASAISTVAQVTGTGEATRGVGTVSISVTVINISGTLINICKHKIIIILCGERY